MATLWQTLKPKDTVRIIAPAADSPKQDSFKNSCEFIKSLNLIPVYSENIFQSQNSYYNFANSDDSRYADFVDALYSDAAAIWCFRGGYGTDRILKRLIANNLQSPPQQKLFIGFSDITNLHSYFNAKWDWTTLHAPALRQLGDNDIESADVDALTDFIFGKKSSLSLALTPMNAAAENNQTLSGKICGGNLTTLQCALGTPWAVNAKNKFLLLEDVGEAPYRIARMLEQFLGNGLAEKTKAVILGNFFPMENMDLVLNEFAQNCKVPVFGTTRVGHERDNFPIPFGLPAKIKAGKQAQLLYAIPR